MSHIYRELKEMEVPTFAHVCKGDGRVFVSKNSESGKRRQLVIGKSTREGYMYPNSNLRRFYPDLWEAAYEKNTPLPDRINVGLYGLLLSIGYATGIYPLLLEIFTPQTANAIMDYSMFCIRERTTATHLLPGSNRNQLIFSEKYYEDSWFSEFFKNSLPEIIIHQFKIAWLKKCAENGHTKVWICVDGSNNDCVIKNSNLARHGNSKSHAAVKVCGYMWAVSAIDGRPITYFLYNGSIPDSQAFEEIEKFLAKANIGIEGFILDRGFATEKIMQLIHSSGYQYIIMLKSNIYSYKAMFDKHAKDIYWQTSQVVNRDGTFGITEYMNVFGSGNEYAYISLFFNPTIGTQKYKKFIAPIFDAWQDIENQLSNGKNIDSIIIPNNVKKYIDIYQDENKETHVKLSDKVQAYVDQGGFSAIASSLNLPPTRINELYNYRDKSEKNFSAFKSQIGAKTMRVHDDIRMKAKYFTCFIAAMIRMEIEISCQNLKLDTNKFIKELDDVHLSLQADGKYLAIYSIPERIKNIFSIYGLNYEHLDYFAEDINNRLNPIHSPIREMPSFTQSKKILKSKEKQERQTTSEETVRGRGRPAGSKNKKTLEKEAREAQMPPKEKRKPGRPKGSKNKKTLEKEAELARQNQKRGPGRPRGSKNKPKIEAGKPSQPNSTTAMPEATKPGQPNSTAAMPEAGKPRQPSSTAAMPEAGKPRQPDNTATMPEATKPGQPNSTAAMPKAGKPGQVDSSAAMKKDAKPRQRQHCGHAKGYETETNGSHYDHVRGCKNRALSRKYSRRL